MRERLRERDVYGARRVHVPPRLQSDRRRRDEARVRASLRASLRAERPLRSAQHLRLLPRVSDDRYEGKRSEPTDLFFFFFSSFGKRRFLNRSKTVFPFEWTQVLDNTTIVSACEPVCEPNCVNATCTEPNVCTCDHGFAKDANDRCEPVCSFCRNGSCVAPNVCRCWQGFVPAEEHGCVPYCENGCENGECVAPNQCTCHEGFESSGNKSRCVVERVPVCTQPCKGHSVCVEDEKPCQCSYGWTGLECDQPTLCILVMNSDDENLVGWVYTLYTLERGLFKTGLFAES